MSSYHYYFLFTPSHITPISLHIYKNYAAERSENDVGVFDRTSSVYVYDASISRCTRNAFTAAVTVGRRVHKRSGTGIVAQRLVTFFRLFLYITVYFYLWTFWRPQGAAIVKRSGKRRSAREFRKWIYSIFFSVFETHFVITLRPAAGGFDLNVKFQKKVRFENVFYLKHFSMIFFSCYPTNESEHRRIRFYVVFSSLIDATKKQVREYDLNRMLFETAFKVLRDI